MLFLTQLLPISDQYKYNIMTVLDEYTAPDAPKSENTVISSFHAFFSVTIGSPEEFSIWKTSFEAVTATQFNIIHTKRNHMKSNNVKPHSVKSASHVRSVNFKQFLKCHHNVKGGKVGLRKHTACPARLKASIDIGKSVCKIDLQWNHNHPIVAADVLRLHRVTEKTDAKLVELFKCGHSASSARDCIRMELEDSLKEDERSKQMLADRSVCPDYQHCQYVFRKLCKELYGSSKGHGRIHNEQKLMDFIENTNCEMGGLCIARAEFESKSLIAICTPFMHRVHALVQEAGEVMFVDSSGKFDRNGYRVFLLMTHSKAGGRREPLKLSLGSACNSLELVVARRKAVFRLYPKEQFTENSCVV